MYQETRPSTEEIVDIYADNIPPVEGTSLDCALPFRKQYFEVKKNDLFCSTLERPEIKEILEPENYNDVIDAIVLKPVIKAEDKKIDVDSTFELILERPMEPISEEAKKVSFLSMEPEVLEVNEKGELNAQVNLGQAYVNCSWRSGVSKDLLVTIGEVSEIKPYQPGNSVIAPEEEIVVPGTPVGSEEELASAISGGGELKLEAGIELLKTLILASDVETTINLNGQKVIAPQSTEDSTCFQVDAGHLILQGDGEVIAQEATYSNAIYAKGGQVDILGGTYSNAGDNCDLIYAAGTAQINIYDGIFKATKNNGASGTANEYSVLNIKDADRATAKITVYGGKFYGFDPSNNLSEGKNTNFVAEGYESVQEGDWYIVSKKEE